MAYCGKCLHLDVCKTADSCCGSVPKCKHFIEKGILIAGSDGVRNGAQAVPYGGRGRNGTQAVSSCGRQVAAPTGWKTGRDGSEIVWFCMGAFECIGCAPGESNT